MSPQATSERIIIVGGDFGFPNGAGAAARVRCYAEGLRRAGATALVVIAGVVAPHEIDEGNTQVVGEWHGVPFEYASGAVRGAPTFLGRRHQEVRSLRRLAHLILRRDEDGPSAVMLYGYVPRWLWPLRVLCTLRGVPLLIDISEYPYVYKPAGGLVRRAWRKVSLHLALRLPDGIIVITGFLEQALRPYVRRRAWMLLVPIMVDASRFDVPVEPVAGLIVYAGNLGHRDELDELIAATARLVPDHPAARLEIIGGAGDEQSAGIRAEVAAAELGGRVDLVGSVSADEMPRRLARAGVLVLARADGLFSRAGMPTKLGEYLATGRPVVVSATGDIPLYLHDGVDSYLVPPGDQARLSEAIGRALDDPGSGAIGASGREVAVRSFDPGLQMARLLGMLRDGERHARM